jgi:CheY-like chemotaxis protein
MLTFVVTDTGLGIRPDQINKLFAPFSQADVSTKRKYGGTGLGLVLSKRFANLLGGDVVLSESTPDKGSTFTITIDPGAVVSSSAQSQMAKLNDSSKSGLRLDGIKVLLAEDSIDNQTLVTRFLKLAGASVDIASDGKEATQKAKSDHYDVLLMDLQMPVMDGYEATSQLRREGYQGKIVALTAHALSEERDRCLKSGFDDHISKPVNRDLLIERVYHCAREQSIH